MDDLSGTIIRGYELRDKIGTGGFGAVYTAFQPLVSREVAIKIILPKYANHPDFIRRFDFEAQLVARLEHPFIIPLYDYWREPNSAFLVMRWLRGGNLEKLLEQGPLELATAVRILDQIASALAVSHRAGVVHRDLKPANILLDNDGNAYLADFGIAKIATELKGIPDIDDLDNHEHADETIVGSPAYLAPEQIGHQPVTHQTDIYALGIVLYQMLAGKHPFPLDKLFDLLQHHLRKSVPKVLDVRPDLPPDVDRIIQTATAKRAEDRYDSVMQMPSELWTLLTGYEKTGHFALDNATIPMPNELEDTAEGIPFQNTLIVNTAPRKNPYKGLQAFEEADAEDFFGRNELIEHIKQRLTDDDEYKRFLAVVGSSGSGKSSVVKAGLIPAIRRGELPESDQWFIVEMLPGNRPLEELETAFLSIATNVPDHMLERLQANEYGIINVLDEILPDDGSELLLYIDQFEEVFTRVENEFIRQRFLDSLHTCITDPSSRIRIIITIRADFYDRPLNYSGFGDLVRRRTEVVLPLSREELRAAIVGPAERAGIYIDDQLVAAMIEDVNAQPSALPLLQYALTELFNRRTDNTITLSTYEATGGVSGALARRAEDLYKQLEKAGKQAARQLFLRLVQLGEGSDDTRRRIHWNEVVSLKERNPTVQTVIDTYGKYRLLAFDVDPVNRIPTLGIAHEALINQWDRMRRWLDDNREDLILHRRLTSAAAEWAVANRDDSYLATGTRLDQWIEWEADSDLVLTQEEADFLHDSMDRRQRIQDEEAERLAREERLERRSRRFLYAFVVFLVIAAIGSLALSLVALNQRSEAQEARTAAEENAQQAEINADQAQSNAEEAERNAQEAELNAAVANRNSAEAQSLRLATGAQLALTDHNTDLALLLALEANHISRAPLLAQRSLFEAAYAPGTRFVFDMHEDWVLAVAHSPTQPFAVTGGQDNILYVINTNNNTILTQMNNHTDNITAIEYSANGSWVVSGSTDQTVILWNTTLWLPTQTFSGHEAPVLGVAITRSGQRIVSSDQDGVIILWDTDTGEEIRRFERHNGAVWDVEFSVDGSRLISVGEEGNAIVWDVMTGIEMVRYTGHDGRIYSVDVSPDGQWVATAGIGSNSINLWNIDTADEERHLVGHADWVYDATFSPDGRTVLSSSQDTTIRLWDVDSGSEIIRLSGHDSAVRSIAYNVDGTRAISGSYDTVVRLWDIENGAEIDRLVGHGSDVYAVAINHDGTRAISASADNALILWNLERGRQIRRFEGHTDRVRDVAFDPEDRLAVSASYDNTLILWDVNSGDAIRQFVGHTDQVRAVAYSPDGTKIVSGSLDNTVRVWDVRTGETIHILEGHEGWVRGVDISRDGRYILSGSGGDMTVRLWDMQTGEQLHIFEGHTDWLWDVAFSPDGNLAASSASDSTIILWDLETYEIVRRYEGHTGPVYNVAFSPFGLRILSASADGTVRLWDVETGAEYRRLQGHTSGVWGIDVDPTGERVLSASGDQTLVLWRVSDVFELQRWVTNNRYIRELTCYEREQFDIEPDIEACQNLQ